MERTHYREYRENLSPHDGENLGEFPSSAAADLHDAVEAAKVHSLYGKNFRFSNGLHICKKQLIF